MSTLAIPAKVPSPRDDARSLHDAFKGLRCDNSAVISILAHRNSAQIERIQESYDNKYPEELRKRVSSELHGHFKKAVLLWLREPMVRNANILKHALRDTVQNLKVASDVICSSTPSQLRKLKQVYQSSYGAPVEQDIENATHGDHKKLLLAYINTTRYEGPEIDETQILNDANAIKRGENVFIQIFSERSAAHLFAVNNVYSGMYGPLEKAIKKDRSENFGYALLAILRFVENPAKYFARVLRKAMKGLGTHDSSLIWVIVTRAEIDLQYIKEEYKRKYGKSLSSAVSSEISGHYRSFLLALLGPKRID